MVHGPCQDVPTCVFTDTKIPRISTLRLVSVLYSSPSFTILLFISFLIPAPTPSSTLNYSSLRSTSSTVDLSLNSLPPSLRRDPLRSPSQRPSPLSVPFQRLPPCRPPVTSTPCRSFVDSPVSTPVCPFYPRTPTPPP